MDGRASRQERGWRSAAAQRRRQSQRNPRRRRERLRRQDDVLRRRLRTAGREEANGVCSDARGDGGATFRPVDARAGGRRARAARRRVHPAARSRWSARVHRARQGRYRELVSLHRARWRVDNVRRARPALGV